MKKKKMILEIVLVAVFAFSVVNCSAQSGGSRSFNNVEELKAYLDKQPVNSPDKPIKVSMTINDPMIERVAEVIKSAGKYISLNISGNALTTIPGYAFEDCKTLVNINIPNSVTSIQRNAFDSCTSLSSITIPNSVTSIGDSAFQWCTNLTSVTIGNGVTRIGSQAFMDCNNLTSIIIPESVTRIGDEAFEHTKLTSVTFQGTITAFNFGVEMRKSGWSRERFVSPFFGDLREKYLAGGIGTYTIDSNYVWTKQ